MLEFTNARNKQAKILVLGDLMIDHYLWGTCDRISPEAPVQVVDIKNETALLGGAGNVVNNLLALEAKVHVISVLGFDEIAKELSALLGKNENISFDLIQEEDRKSSKKSRVMASHSQILRFDNESKENINKTSEEKVLECFKACLDDYDLVLLSDYGKGVLTKALLKDILIFAKTKNKKVLIDPKGKDFVKYKGAYLLTPNKKEAELVCDFEIRNKESLEHALKKIKDLAELEKSLITLSEDGIGLYDGKKVQTCKSLALEVYDVTGAGDTVLAALGFYLCFDDDILSAINFANLAAGVVVAKLGSASANLDEIRTYQENISKEHIENSIKSLKELAKITKRLKKAKQKIVFTNGCFDILHKGHISYLQKAKSFGDILIIGLNCDASVRRLKGNTRPINCQDDRAFCLGALESVDYVVIFGEDTPLKLIETLKPDVLVKGGDYKNKNVVGSELVSDLRLVDFVDGKSTTSIIEKIGHLEHSSNRENTANKENTKKE